MEFKLQPDGDYRVYAGMRFVDQRYIGRVEKVPQDPAWGSGSKPVSGTAMVWIAKRPDGAKVGLFHRTRKAAGEALLNAKEH